MAVERTIVLQGMGKGHHDEGTLDGIASPGMAIQLKSNGNYDVVAATKAESLKRGSVPILKEDAYQGRSYTTAYAVGDKGFIYFPVHGDHLLLYVKAGENIVVGDVLVEEGGGSGKFVEAVGTETRYRAEALESTGGALAADQLVKARWL